MRETSPKELSLLFRGLVLALAASPLAACSATVGPPITGDAGDVTPPEDRADVPPDLGACQPVRGPSAACDTQVTYPCGLPPMELTQTACRTLCGDVGLGSVIFCTAPQWDAGQPVTLTCTWCAVGRRTVGWRPDESPAHDAPPAGQFLARITELEAEAVRAFRRMVRELEALGAPAEMIEQARLAVKEEQLHTRDVGRLARRFGGRPRPPAHTDEPFKVRSFEAVAVENMAEGCVRETFGALVATWQARHARDAEAARVLTTIARDETRHAALSWELARWLDARLDEEGRRAVQRARFDAVVALGEELQTELHRDLVDVLGMPTARVAQALSRGLETTLWAA